MKNILLIGGSYGIGLAIAKELQYENKFTSLQEQ
jgi:3-oxoacyl-[acyl-carrier protein] reductase